MRFGGRQLPMRLRVARVIVYCQALLLGLIAVFTIETLMMGSGAGIRFQGVFASQTLTGSAVTSVIIIQLVAAMVLVVLNHAAEHGGGFRWAMTAVEVAVGAYLVGFISDTASTWVLGPVVCAAVIVLHHWRTTLALALGSQGSDSPSSPPL
jgi:hypothetical protein